MSALTKLTRDKFIPFLDTAEDNTFAANTWKRIDLSTIFAFAMNPQSESMEYICYPNAVEEVSSNQPELPEEIALYEGNEMYDFIFKKFYDMPTGDAVKVPFLMCFGGTGKKAWRGICTLLLDTLDTVEGKISFTIKLGGEIEKGTYTIESGAPTFTVASA